MSDMNDLIYAFRVLFQVWEGTVNADVILTDATRTIGHELYGWDSATLDVFLSECRRPVADDIETIQTGG